MEFAQEKMVAESVGLSQAHFVGVRFRGKNRLAFLSNRKKLKKYA
jgi:hypothetical protein